MFINMNDVFEVYEATFEIYVEDKLINKQVA